MAKKSNQQKLFEDIGSARTQIDNENESLEYNILQPVKQVIPELVSYIENQVDNLKDYAEALRKVCKNDICGTYLDAQVDELELIKSELCRNLDRAIYPPEEPSMNQTGFLTHFFKTSAPIFGDLMQRLNRTLVTLDSIHTILSA